MTAFIAAGVFLLLLSYARIGCAGPKRQRVGSGKAAKAAVEAAMAAANPEQAASNKAAEKAAKAAAQRKKAAAKGKAKKAADSASGNSNVWGPYEAPRDEEIDPEALVKSKVGFVWLCFLLAGTSECLWMRRARHQGVRRLSCFFFGGHRPVHDTASRVRIVQASSVGAFT